MNTKYYVIIIGMVFVVVSIAHRGLSTERESTHQGGYVITYPSVERRVPSVPHEAAGTPIDGVLSTVPPLPEHTGDVMPLSSEEEQILAVKEHMISSLTKQLEMKNRKIQLLEQRLERVSQKLQERETELFMMQPKKKMNVYEVKKGDSLWKIAARTDTYSNPYMWIKIYNSNMSKIQDPNLIYPGQLFDIPK